MKQKLKYLLSKTEITSRLSPSQIQNHRFKYTLKSRPQNQELRHAQIQKKISSKKNVDSRFFASQKTHFDNFKGLRMMNFISNSNEGTLSKM